MRLSALAIGACLGGAATSYAAGVLAQCVTDADCKGGRTCVSGVCQAPATACTKDTDCPDTQVCSAGACTPQDAAPVAPAAEPSAAPSPAPTAAQPPTSTSVAPPSPPPPPQPTMVTTTEPIAALYVPGIIVLSTGYGLSIIASAVAAGMNSDGGYMLGAIPLAGPWIVIGMYGDTKGMKEGMVALPIVCGSLQVLGLTGTILGFALEREVTVPAYATLGDGERAVLEVGPMAAGSGVGLAVSLRAAPLRGAIAADAGGR